MTDSDIRRLIVDRIETLALDPKAQAARDAGIGRLRASIPEGPGGDIAL